MFTRKDHWCGIVIALGLMATVTPTVTAQTALPQGHEISLLPGYTHQPVRGIDSVIGRIGKKDGLQIRYTMGPIVAKGERRTSGHFVNAAQGIPEKDRLWFKEQTVAGRKVYAVFSKDYGLIVSTISASEGVNFSAMAKTPDEVADVLLMALTLKASKRDN